MKLYPPLWKPGIERREKSNIEKFRSFINSRYDLALNNYDEIYDWSVHNIENFWLSLLKFSGFVASGNTQNVLAKSGLLATAF